MKHDDKWCAKALESGCKIEYTMTKLESISSEFIRDITKIGSIPKSEAKRRLQEIINTVIEDVIGEEE